MSSVVSFDQHDFAAAVMALMFGHPMTNRPVAFLLREALKRLTGQPFLHMRDSLSADPDGQMRFLGTQNQDFPNFRAVFASLGVKVSDSEGMMPPRSGETNIANSAQGMNSSEPVLIK